MNDALFLFLILLLGLLLCSFLGGNCGKEAFETKNSNKVIKNNATGTGKPMSTNFDNYNISRIFFYKWSVCFTGLGTRL